MTTIVPGDAINARFGDGSLLVPSSYDHNFAQFTLTKFAQPRKETERKIPHKLHFVWLGPNPIPYDAVAPFTTLNPDWPIVIWVDHHEDRHCPLSGNVTHMNTSTLMAHRSAIGTRYVSDSQYRTSMGECSDLIRFSALRVYGGVYSDFDVLPVRPFSDMIQGCHFVAGLEGAHSSSISPSTLFASTAIIASVPLHPIWDDISSCLERQWVDMELHDPRHTMAGRTAGLFSDIVKVHGVRDDRVLLCPPALLHPRGVMSTTMLRNVVSQQRCYAVHDGAMTGAM